MKYDKRIGSGETPGLFRKAVVTRRWRCEYRRSGSLTTEVIFLEAETRRTARFLFSDMVGADARLLKLTPEDARR